MKRAGISFLALTTLLCGLFFLTACKKGPLSLDQQFDVYSKAKPVSILMEKPIIFGLKIVKIRQWIA